MGSKRSRIQQIIKHHVRHYRSFRHDPKFGRIGVYHYMGVDKAADAILKLLEKDRKAVILKALVEGLEDQRDLVISGVTPYIDVDNSADALLDGRFNLETLAEQIDKALSDAVGKQSTDKEEKAEGKARRSPARARVEA